MKIAAMSLALPLLASNPTSTPASSHTSSRSQGSTGVLGFVPPRPNTLGRINPSTKTPTPISSLQGDLSLKRSPASTTSLSLFSRWFKGEGSVNEGKHVEKRVEKREDHLDLLAYQQPLPAGSVVIPPADRHKEGGDSSQSAIVLMPGTHINPEQYRYLVQAIQKASDHPVWVAIPKLPFQASNPISEKLLVQQSIHALKQEGFTGSQVMLAGHSLAGIFLPNALPEGVNSQQIAGLIYLGSYGLRADREGDNLATTLPTLTVAGDLDGLVRPARLAESLHHQMRDAEAESSASSESSSTESRGNPLKDAIILVEGMNHMQFATGTAPMMVRMNDLPAEISTEAAQTAVADSVAQFIDAHQFGNQTALDVIADKAASSERYLTPLMDAMALEGSYHFTPPCHLNEEAETCTLGSSWAEWAQEELAGLDPAESATLNITDEFHQTWWINFFSEPHFYHPHIHNVTADPESGDLTVNMGTVTEAVYEKMDSFDNSLFTNTPKELRSKFNSRQAILKAINVDVPFDRSELPNICSRINQKTIDWALSKAPEKVRERYLDRGIQLVAGKDIEHNSGPAWIWSYLEFNPSQDETTGREVRVLDSHTMKTPLDHPVPFSEGKHYCKLLSPSRALDWMHTDALRGQEIRFNRTDVDNGHDDVK